MCGILGYFSYDTPIDEKVFNRMRDSLWRRGPDGADSKFFNNNLTALGHRRLSIVDLSDAGRQPMCNEDGTVWLSYNGELYNHEVLAAELKKLGHVYKSKCDAETIIHAWEEWGDNCVSRFRGIFAFVIWDQKKQLVFGARDHLGVKPFYYSNENNTLVVASQLRAIVSNPQFSPEIHPRSFADYLYFGVVPHDRSIMSHVKKLPPGSTISLQHGNLKIVKYWEVQYTPTITNFEEAKGRLAETIEEAVSMQLMSDVPYGTFLSGGIDSSLITAIAAEHSNKPIPSLTVGFDSKKRDERPYAEIIANHSKTKHIEERLGFKQAKEQFNKLAEIYDEPYALGAGIPLAFIAECTKKHGLKVMLAGDGADELFAGYHHYDDVKNGNSDIYTNYQSHEALLKDKSELRVIGSKLQHVLCEGPQWRFNRFLGATSNNVVNAQLLDVRTYLPDEILTKVDRASMAYGVEVRVPFLDPKLVELSFSISHELNYRRGERKALLKEIAKKWLPPSAITQRKKGFSIPFLRWMMRPSQWLKMYKTVNNGILVQLDLINGDKFRREGLFLPPAWLWKLYTAELWAQRWIA